MDKLVAGHSVAAWKKSGIGALVGAIVGAGTVAGLMHVAGTDFIDAMGGSRVAPTGPVPAQAAAAVLALVITGGVAASWAWRRQYDELNRQLGIEGGYWAFGLSWIGLTLWGAADFLGLGPALTAIDVVTTLAAMMLVGAFVAIGRRGLMMR